MDAHYENSIELIEALEEYGCDLEVLREYDLECESVRLVRGALRIKTPTGFLMLKRISGSPDLPEFMFQVLEHVHENYPHVPRFIRNKYGDPYVIHESGCFYLAEWLSGREANFRKTEQLESAAAALGKFHLATSGFVHGLHRFSQFEDDFVLQGQFSANRLKNYMEFVDRQIETNTFEELFETTAPYLLRMIEHAHLQGQTEYYRRIVEGAREARVICHGSMTAQNILIESDQVSFVDFSHCFIGIPTTDLGALLSRYMPRFDWEFEIGKSIIDSYSEVRELARLDIHGLALYLSFPTRPLSIIEAYFENSRDWDLDRYCSELQKSIIDEEGREEFVQYLIDTYTLDLIAPDFAYEIPIEDGIDLDDRESSSLHSGFIRETDWQTDFQKAMEDAHTAIAPLTQHLEQNQDDPTASTIQFSDTRWETESGIDAGTDTESSAGLEEYPKTESLLQRLAPRPFSRRKRRRLVTEQENVPKPKRKKSNGIWLPNQP